MGQNFEERSENHSFTNWFTGHTLSVYHVLGGIMKNKDYLSYKNDLLMWSKDKMLTLKKNPANLSNGLSKKRYGSKTRGRGVYSSLNVPVCTNPADAYLFVHLKQCWSSVICWEGVLSKDKWVDVKGVWWWSGQMRTLKKKRAMNVPTHKEGIRRMMVIHKRISV